MRTFIYNSDTNDQLYMAVISDWSAARWLRVWLQQVTWAGMHPAPPRPLAFQEQPSMSDRAAFSSSLLCCHMKETCLCLISKSFLLNKWVVCEGKKQHWPLSARFGIYSALFAHCGDVFPPVPDAQRALSLSICGLLCGRSATFIES